MTSPSWPGKLPVRQVRIARPTDQLDEVVRFYCEGLGLPELDPDHWRVVLMPQPLT